jgi:hypothetical protein
MPREDTGLGVDETDEDWASTANRSGSSGREISVLANFNSCEPGEGRGPGDPQTANEDVPYLGEYQDFEIPVTVPERGEAASRVLRIWIGPVVVISQSYELEYADEQDARVLVAPIVSEPLWPNGPWDLIERGALPGCL